MENLKKWNETSKDDIEIDFPFAMALYLSLVPTEEKSNKQLNDDAMVFVQGEKKVVNFYILKISYIIYDFLHYRFDEISNRWK